jgi:cytochrome c5
MRILSALVFFAVIVLTAWRGVGSANMISAAPASKTSGAPANKISGTRDRDTLPRSGAAIFYSSCNPCHKDSSISLAPSYSILTSMEPRAILEALDKGKMRAVAAVFSEEECRSG